MNQERNIEEKLQKSLDNLASLQQEAENFRNSLNKIFFEVQIIYLQVSQVFLTLCMQINSEIGKIRNEVENVKEYNAKLQLQAADMERLSAFANPSLFDSILRDSDDAESENLGQEQIPLFVSRSRESEMLASWCNIPMGYVFVLSANLTLTGVSVKSTATAHQLWLNDTAIAIEEEAVDNGWRNLTLRFPQVLLAGSTFKIAINSLKKGTFFFVETPGIDCVPKCKKDCGLSTKVCLMIKLVGIRQTSQ